MNFSSFALVILFSTAACTGDQERDIPTVDVNAVPVEPGTSPLRRLTQQQYRHTIRDLIGPDVLVPDDLEPDAVVDGLAALGGSLASISPLGVEQYEAAAVDIMTQLVAKPALLKPLVPCQPGGVDDVGCMKSFVRQFGKSAWRRPLSKDEENQLTAVGIEAAQSSASFNEGAGYAISAMLQSPYFLFRIELGINGSFDAWETASRLSYFLNNTLPDAELQRAAEAGELATREGMRVQAQRLMEKPEAHEAVLDFFSELYQLYRLDDIAKDPEIFAGLYAELGPDAREETSRLIEYLVFDKDADFRTFFTTQQSFVNSRLAALYGIEAPSDKEFGLVVLPRSLGRRGILGLAGFLALQSHPSSTSAVLRGRYIRQTLLCGEVPSPPSNLNTGISDANDAPTLRERVADHLANPVCASCHNQMDPIGLGFENFDGIGAFRTLEEGAPIDASGELDGKKFSNAWELGGVIAQHPNLGACLARNTYRYATGHAEEQGEALYLEKMAAFFAASGYSVKSLWIEMASSDAFRASGVNP